MRKMRCGAGWRTVQYPLHTAAPTRPSQPAHGRTELRALEGVQHAQPRRMLANAEAVRDGVESDHDQVVRNGRRLRLPCSADMKGDIWCSIAALFAVCGRHADAEVQ